MLIQQGAMPLHPECSYGSPHFTVHYCMLYFCYDITATTKKRYNNQHIVQCVVYYTSFVLCTPAPLRGSLQIALRAAIISPLSSDIMAIYCMHISYQMCNNIFKSYIFRKPAIACSKHKKYDFLIFKSQMDSKRGVP